MTKSKNTVSKLCDHSQQLDEPKQVLYDKILKYGMSLRIAAPNSEKEASRLIAKLKKIHSRVIPSFKEAKLQDAIFHTNLQKSDLEILYASEIEIVKMLRPIFCKPELQNINIDIESIKFEIVDAFYYLGLIYLKKDDYFNHYVKAATIFQYCSQLSDKFNISNHPIVQEFLMKTAIYGDNFYHPHIVESYNKLGATYLKQGEIDNALSCYYTSFTLATQTHNAKSDCPNIIKFFNDLENSHNNQENYLYNTSIKMSELLPSKNIFVYKRSELSIVNESMEFDSKILDITNNGTPYIVELHGTS